MLYWLLLTIILTTIDYYWLLLTIIDYYWLLSSINQPLTSVNHMIPHCFFPNITAEPRRPLLRQKTAAASPSRKVPGRGNGWSWFVNPSGENSCLSHHIMYIYIYTYIYREREKWTVIRHDKTIYRLYTYIYIYMSYIYIYTPMRNSNDSPDFRCESLVWNELTLAVRLVKKIIQIDDTFHYESHVCICNVSVIS